MNVLLSGPNREYMEVLNISFKFRLSYINLKGKIHINLFTSMSMCLHQTNRRSNYILCGPLVLTLPLHRAGGQPHGLMLISSSRQNRALGSPPFALFSHPLCHFMHGLLSQMFLCTVFIVFRTSSRLITSPYNYCILCCHLTWLFLLFCFTFFLDCVNKSKSVI